MHLRRAAWVLSTLALGASASAHAQSAPAGEPVEVTLAEGDDARGHINALLGDGRGLVQREEGGPVQVVDAQTGAPLVALAAAVPRDACALFSWGSRPALVCNRAVYTLDAAARRWESRAPVRPENRGGLAFSDDGVHMASTQGACPGAPSPGPCVYGPAGWRPVPGLGRSGPVAGSHGARTALLEHAQDASPPHLALVDADTLSVTREPVGGRANAGLAYFDSVAWDPTQGSRWGGALFFLAHSARRSDEPHGNPLSEALTPREFGNEAGVLAMRAPDGAWRTAAATSAPRERWGVHVAFFDERRGVAAGSFYRDTFYTTDAGAHWTRIAGADPARDARVRPGRLMEDSAMRVRCDVAGFCRIDTRGPELVVRFRR